MLPPASAKSLLVMVPKPAPHSSKLRCPQLGDPLRRPVAKRPLQQRIGLIGRQNRGVAIFPLLQREAKPCRSREHLANSLLERRVAHTCQSIARPTRPNVC